VGGIFTLWNPQSNRLIKEQTDLCFIQETKCNLDKMETISKKYWSKYNMLAVKIQQMAGGIFTLWNPQSVNLLVA